jgi:hypothetical protein
MSAKGHKQTLAVVYLYCLGVSKRLSDSVCITKADLIEVTGGDLNAYMLAELNRAVDRRG